MHSSDTRIVGEEACIHSARITHMTTESKAMDPVNVGTARLLRIEDVAERLSISRSMAWKLVAYGQIKCLRIGRAVRVRPQDLEDYLVAISPEG
jgi:excisionase family DNA binding protein